MKKNKTLQRILMYNAIVLFTMVAGGWLHAYLLEKIVPNSAVPVFSMYVFFAGFSILIITAIELLFKTMPNQIGYVFLIGVFIKLGFFTILFLSKGLLEKSVLLPERFAMILPLFLFIGIEVIAVGSLLKQNWKSEK